MTSLTNKSGIYKIINKINNKYYVGRTVDLRKRWREHKLALKKNKHSNDILQHSWNKHGESNFEFIIIEVFDTIELSKLVEIEQKYLDIAKNEQHIAFNLCFQADFGSDMLLSEYSKKKISDAHKGKKFTEEHKKNISLAHIGKVCRPVSQETKNKMSKAHKGKQCGELNGMYGKTFSDEQKKKWSDERKGENNPNYGKTQPEEMKRRISETLKSKYASGEIRRDSNIYTFENTITKEIFIGYRFEFRNKYNLKKNWVSNLIRGVIKSSQNWILVHKKEQSVNFDCSFETNKYTIT